MKFSLENIALAAGEATVSPAVSQPSLFESLVPFLLIAVFMYFLMIRPQVKKAKEHQALLKGLKVGDEVITTGGIIGRIRSIADGFVTLDLGSTTIKILKEHVTQPTRPATGAVETASKDKGGK